MNRRQILKDGTDVSEIGLGCWSFAGAYGATTEAEAHRTLDAARDMGVDFLDTANVYGMGVSETIIGTYLKGKTHPFKLATKAGIWRNPDTGQRGFNNKPEYLRGELEASLKRLGLECVDLYYMHRRDQEVPIEDLMGTLLSFKAEGKIRGIGFSEISPATLRQASAVGPVDAVQSEYSLWTRQPELGMIETCKTLGVAFVPFSPLGRGMLTDTPPDPSTFQPGHFRTGTPRFSEPNFTRNVAQIDAFRALARDLGVSTPALALAWCLSQGSHLIPIPGTRHAAHLRECVSASEIVITEEIAQSIDAVLPRGWVHGDRYSPAQWPGVEGYC